MKIIRFFQKHLGVIALIIYGLLFIYSLTMATPIAALNKYPGTIEGVEGPDYYGYIQPYNNLILIVSLFGLVISSLYSLFKNKDRRLYFASNFIWFTIFIAYSIFTCLIGINSVLNYQALFMYIDTNAVNTYFAERNLSYSINPNTSIFLLGYIASILVGVLALPAISVFVARIIQRVHYKKTGVVIFKNERKDLLTYGTI